MNRELVKKELKKMLEIERKILQSYAEDLGTEDEMHYITGKLFEIAGYIVALKSFLEGTKDDN